MQQIAGPPMHARVGILARNESSPSGRVIATDQSAPPGRNRCNPCLRNELSPFAQEGRCRWWTSALEALGRWPRRLMKINFAVRLSHYFRW